jgi:Tfp pilus assembly protein PilX
MRMQPTGNERGVALFLTLILMMVVTSLAMAAIMLSSNATLIGRFHAKEAEMRASADAGLEWARDTINGTPTLLPATNFVTLQDAQPVRDAGGNVIPGYTRSVFAGRSGATTGQFGVYASAISRIDDAAGRAVVVRRGELSQESFAQFARFDDTTTSSVVFANGIQVFGPIHTNGILYVGNTPSNKANFHGLATTAATISTVSNGNFRAGYRMNAPRINLPTTTALATLSTYAAQGNTSVLGGAVGTTVYNPQTRIEFVPVDINGDGDFTDENEGFLRVYRANNTTAGALNYVTARRWNSGSANDPNVLSPNCGDAAGGVFMTAAAHTNGSGAPHNHSTVSTAANQRASLGHATRRCYLGGDPRLTNGWQANTSAPGNFGAWVTWPGYAAGPAPAAVAAGTIHPALGGGVVGNAMAPYLWPINRPFNPNFKGVIYVNGSVGVSGIVRGQVTVATTGNILLADDLTYVTSPGSVPDCDRSGGVNADILGLLTPQFFVIEDNNVNTPFRNGTTAYVKAYDETADETVHSAILTLNSVLSEDVGNGPDATETCAGGLVGRGCFNMVGAAIQGKNAARMSSSGGGATGWNPQWTYDRCDAVKPPPYFPTTGRYFKNRYYEIDPVGFTVEGWFTANQ